MTSSRSASSRAIPRLLPSRSCGLLDYLLGRDLQFINSLSDFPLRRARRRFQPEIVDLREQAILAGQPTVAEKFPLRLFRNRGRFSFQSRRQVAGGLVEAQAYTP